MTLYALNMENLNFPPGEELRALGRISSANIFGTFCMVKPPRCTRMTSCHTALFNVDQIIRKPRTLYPSFLTQNIAMR